MARSISNIKFCFWYMASEVLTIRISPKMKTDLEDIAKALNRSKSYVAEMAIKEFIENNAWQIKELQEIEKEIEEGNFISHEEVQKYLATWGKPKSIK